LVAVYPPYAFSFLRAYALALGRFLAYRAAPRGNGFDITIPVAGSTSDCHRPRGLRIKHDAHSLALR
jgi:hypothetical protein